MIIVNTIIPNLIPMLPQFTLLQGRMHRLLCPAFFLSHLTPYSSATFGEPIGACLLLAVDTSPTSQR